MRHLMFKLFLLTMVCQCYAVDSFLFEAYVPQTQDELYDQKQALGHVLVKLSGCADCVEGKLSPLLSYAEAWVDSYHYKKSGDGQVPMTHYRFDQESILSALKKHGVMPWLLLREKTLLIVVLDHDGQTSLITANSTLPIAHQFQSGLNQRALPFVFLNKDVSPHANAKDLWKAQAAQVKALASSYQVDQVALIKLVFQPDNRTWQGRMSVTSRLGQRDQMFEQSNLAHVVSSLADGLLTSTYELSKVIDAVDNESLVQINMVGVQSAEQLQAIVHELKSQAKVKSVSLRALRGDTLTLVCDLVGSSSKFMRELLTHPQFSYQAKVSSEHKTPVWVLRWQLEDDHA